MSKSKKGISPLIATVLILGLTVVLAALVAMWSTQFTKDTTKSVTESAEIQTTCASDVSFEIKSICKPGNPASSYSFIISNDGNQQINNFKVRIYKDATHAEARSVVGNSAIASFAIASITVTPSSALGDQQLQRVELFPMITVNGKDAWCPSATSFGELGGANLVASLPAC